MKFNITQEVFSNILQSHLPVLPARTTIPILNSLKWDLKDGRLRMHSTDLEISLITETEVDSEVEGSIAVPARKLSEIVRELLSESITVTADESFRLKLQGSSGVYQIAGSNPEDFPAVPVEGMDLRARLTGEKFKNLINNTSFCVSHDEMRPTLCGVFLQISPEDLRAVSTDGHRLSKFIYTEYKNEGAGYEAIVPVKALSLAAKSITDEEEVKIHSGDKYLILEYQGNLLYTRLIEGKYPLYENVIPKTNKNILVGNVEAMTSSVRRVSIFSNSISRQVKMSITAQNMVITAEDIETGGEAEEKINIDYQGEDMMVGFNASYMLDALRHIDSEEVKVLFGTPDSACIIEPLNQQDEEQFLMLLMPVRLT